MGKEYGSAPISSSKYILVVLRRTYYWERLTAYFYFFSSYYFYSSRFFLIFICLKSHANEKTWCARRRFDWKTEKIVDIASSKKFQLYFASFPFMLLVSYIPKGLYNYDSLFYREKNCFLDCRFGDIVSFIRIFTWLLRRKEAILVIPHYYVEALITLHRSTNC